VIDTLCTVGLCEKPSGHDGPHTRRPLPAEPEPVKDCTCDRELWVMGYTCDVCGGAA
jgi:hypothetical protein